MHLNFYKDNHIADIIRRSATLLDVGIDEEALSLLSTRARHTPRIANRLLKRTRDFAQVRSNGHINEEACQGALNMLGVDHAGLDQVDRHILQTIEKKFSGGPVGLSTIAAATQEEIQTIEDIHEPYLIKIGFLQRTPRGRTITQRGKQHVNAMLK